MKTTTDISDQALANLPGALDLAVFERVEKGSCSDSFRPVGSMPVWLALPPGETVDLSEQFPMLDMFLPELEPLWQGVSDIWTDKSAQGDEIYLQAVARCVGDRRFLVLKTLPEALYTYQQLAHDFELEKEKVERLSRELEIKRQEADRATRAKSEFLARMSHEIRTPLNAVIGMADVLATTTLNDEQRQCVEVSQRNGIGLLDLINDILDISKVESGRIELEQTGMDLREVIARAMDVVQHRAAAKGLWLRQTMAPETPIFLVGDPNRLRQVLINLLGNSIKFTERGGLDVYVVPDPGVAPEAGEDVAGLRFAVADTGVGIAPDKIGAIFESFTQADASTTREYGGSGLGLTISRQLVELMGGRIWVESTPGAGSTFFFTAKFGIGKPGASEALPSADTSADPPIPAKGWRILLADDSDDNRFLVLSYLKRTDSCIDVAENGAIAVDLFRANRYDVVLMDVEMPLMDGYEATREIRAFEKISGATATPIVALTAHAFAETAQRGMEAGFNEILTKPIRSSTLLKALGKYSNAENNGAATGQTARITKVRVDDGMEDIVPAYLAKRRAEVAAYRDALAQGDLALIRMMAHRMKGTGAAYGFPALTTLGSALEQSANRGDTSGTRRNLDELAVHLNSIELVFNAQSAGDAKVYD